LINLLSVPTLNPATPVTNSAGNVVNWKVDNNINTYYAFNASDTTGTAGTAPSTYFGSANIAPPTFACANQANKNQMFSKNFPDWISTINSAVDLRGFYVSCSSNKSSYVSYLDNKANVLYNKSPITHHDVAFTT